VLHKQITSHLKRFLQCCNVLSADIADRPMNSLSTQASVELCVQHGGRVVVSQEETVRVEMQRYSDISDELKSSQDLCAQLEARCTEKSTELEQIRATMEETQQALDVTISFFPVHFAFSLTINMIVNAAVNVASF